MKRRLSVLLIAALLLCALPATASAALVRLNPQTIVDTTWYGEFTSYIYGSDKPYRQASTLTITSCDQDGNFTATTYDCNADITSNFGECEARGVIDFSTGAFSMSYVKLLSHKNWRLDDNISGTITDNGISGVLRIANGQETSFYWARTSEWALGEVNEANIELLIPETLRGADLTQSITRGEFAAVSVSLYEKLTGTALEPYEGDLFTDISGNANEIAIRKAYAANIAVGTGDGLFAPDEHLTREQLVTMLTRVIKKYTKPDWTLANDDDYHLDTSSVARFADDDIISDWAKPSAYYLTKMGIVNGVGNNCFAPRATTPEEVAEGYATATREQAIILALRIYKSAHMF